MIESCHYAVDIDDVPEMSSSGRRSSHSSAKKVSYVFSIYSISYCIDVVGMKAQSILNTLCISLNRIKTLLLILSVLS